MVDVLRLVVLAMEIQEDSCPNLAFGEGFVELLDPRGLDEKEVEAEFGAMLLDAVNKEIIRIEFVGHHHVIGPDHSGTIFVRSRFCQKEIGGKKRRKRF